MTGKKTVQTDVNAGTFSKMQVLTSEKYAHRRDIVSVLLEEDKEYSVDQIDTLIKGFMERKVQ